MVKIKFSVKNALIQKYTLLLTAVFLVMTFMNLMNRIHYIGSIYAMGVILMGITNHIHNSLSITGIGCILDMIHLIFRSSNSSWTSVRYVKFITNFLAIVYEVVYMIMLHCYWQYTEETKNQPQTPLLKIQTLLPVKPTETDLIAPMQQLNSATPNYNVETSEPTKITETTKNVMEPSATMTKPSTAPVPNVDISKPSAVPGRSAEAEPSAVTEPNVPSSKPMILSTELNTNVAPLEPIEATEPGNPIELGNDALTDSITPMQRPDLAVPDSNIETQKHIIEEIKTTPILEQDVNATIENLMIPETSATVQEASEGTPELKRGSQEN